jgi:hypothetical protein
MMKDTVLPEDADQLLAFGQSLLTVMSERPGEWGSDREVEALLRESIATETYAINTYMAVMADAQKSPVAAGLVREARARCERNVGYLRRRITRSSTHVCRYLSNRDLMQAEQYVMLPAG